MIAVKLMGGLGNQMFQYAAARAMAADRNCPVFLDLSFLETPSEGKWTQRYFELDVFNIESSTPENFSVRLLKRLNSNSRWNRISNSPVLMFPYRNYYESLQGFHPELLKLPQHVYLQGYFQSEQYFLRHESLIRKEFTFKTPATGKNAEVLQQILNSNAVSLHVRRGDYVSLPSAAEYHALTGLPYYQRAVEILTADNLSMNFFVFSDDPEWCRQHLNLPGTTTIVDWNTGKASYEDLRLMSQCKHHIIANSSFSWWGAWLNPATEKKVIAPKKWVNDQTQYNADLIPVSWIAI
jgi:hypothetical protein